MFIRFFRGNGPAAFVFLPLIAIAIWAFGFMEPAILVSKHDMPLYEILTSMLSFAPWLGTFIAMLFIIAEAFLINYMVSENEVLGKQSYLPALCYVILMSNNNSMLILHPLIPANLFLLFAINKLLSSYRKDIAFSQAFDAGLLISIATLFYFPYIVFFPILGIGLLVLRTFNWREWLISFIGVLVPYLFTNFIYFWKGTLDYLWYDKMLYPIIRERQKVELPESFYFMIGLGWLILLLALGKILGSFGSGPQRTKKGIVLFVWFFFISSLSILIAPEISTKYFAAVAIPASVFYAGYFLNLKRLWMGEVLFLLLIASIFYNLIRHYF